MVPTPPLFGLHLAGLLVFLVCSWIRAAPTQAQHIVGRVLDGAASTPIPGANVYISGTTLGSATKDDGSFEIRGTIPGQQDLVVSMVGYHPVVRQINIPDTGLTVGPIRLDQQVIDAGELVVTTERPKDWERDLERFTREFLGTSPNADDCRILNPYVLDFARDGATNRLRASASRPLQIENRALGYQVTFVLEDFEVADWDYRIRFQGQSRFQELEAEDSLETQQWSENREKAYKGSLQHFLFALARGEEQEEGFDLRVGDAQLSGWGDPSLLPSAETDSIVARGMSPFERLLYSPDALHIIYRGETESKSYQRFMTQLSGERYFARDTQHSIMEFKHGVTMHLSGYLYEPYVVTTYGYWVWERVADMLPRDYKPIDSSGLTPRTD